MALMAAIRALQLLRGGEIITSPYTFSATPAAAAFMGYQPVFADVDRRTFTLDPASVEKVVGPDTVALMPVDLFGSLADYGRLKRLFPHLPIIQDACQAVGATKEWLRGEVAVWSFNGGKNVPAGEAGMVLTNDAKLAMRARLFISHGENFPVRAAEAGYGRSVGINGRLNELTACVAYHGMKDLPKNNRVRRLLAGELWRRLEHRTDIQIPSPSEIQHHALYVYPLVVKNTIGRKNFVERLKRFGVEVGQGYITPTLNKYAALPDGRVPLEMARVLSEHELCLLSQVRPPATLADMRYIATCIVAALDGVIPPNLRTMGFIADSVF